MAKSKTGVRATIIIPTKDRADILKNALGLILAQTRSADIQILVVDDGSGEKEKAKIQNLQSKSIKIISGGGMGPAHARNLAIKKARGEILIFLNDDSYVDKKFIESHLKFHAINIDIDKAVVGLTENHPKTVNVETMKWLVGQSGLHFNFRFNLKTKKTIPWYYLWTCNFSVKKEFLEVNSLRFCEDFPTAAWEDIEFAYRARGFGLKLFLDKKAKVWHFHELSAVDIRNRLVSHGRGLFHLKDKLPPNFLPFLIKSHIGLDILFLFSLLPIHFVIKQIEKLVLWLNIYPNFLMQILVVGWKSEGYYYEKNKSTL